MYPLRARLAKLLQGSGIPQVVVRKHPGYTELKKGTFSAQEREALIRDYAEEMKRAKICIITPSSYRYALRKYNEAALAGCVLVGGIPDERHDEFSRYVLDVESMSDSEFLSEIRALLDDPGRRERMVKTAQEIHLSKYTLNNTVDDVLKGLDLWSAKKFGLYVSHPFYQRRAPLRC